MTPSEQQVLNRLSQLESDARNNVLMNATVRDTVQKVLESVDNKDVELKVKRVWVDDRHDNNDIALQQEIRNKGQIWGADLRAQLELVDKATGKVIDSVDSMKLANIPKLTPRNTYLVKGNEYQFMKQSRLRPGVYTKEQSNGDIMSFFNVDKTIDFDRGFNNNFKLLFTPETKLFVMQYGTKTVPLVNAMAALDVPKQDIIKAWGKDVFEENERKYGGHENINTNKLYLAVFGKTPPKDMPAVTVKQEIKDRLFKTELDPDTTAITLGKSYNQVNSDSLLAASQKVLRVHRGTEEPDDRESLIFKSFFDAEDHIRERLVKNLDKIKWNVGMKLSRTRSINKSLSSQTFDPFISGTITTSQLSNPPNQTNVMSIIGESSKTTVMGEGGIGSSNAVTNDTRNISNSEVGFIDPLHTPEGGSIGIAVHTTVGAMKIGNKLYNKFIGMDGTRAIKSPNELFEKYVAFPDEYDVTGSKPKAKTKHIRAIYRGKMVNVTPDKIDYIVGGPTNMFDTSVNMIPFLDSIQGNRGLTASKMQEQAVSLKNREAPLFDIQDDTGRSMGQLVGTAVGTPKSPVDGEVIAINDGSIVVKDKAGENHDVQMYKNFSLNSESFLDNTPLVAVGAKVKKGQNLADSNFTRNGTLALGANLRVAYLPFKGYNYEDSAIISESGAKKLVSEHMYDMKAKRSAKGVFSKEKFRAYYPEKLPAEAAAKLDKDGVVRVGQTVNRDDVLIAHMERKIPTADDIAMGRFDKALRRDMANNAVTWDNDHVGVVTAVQKHGNSVVVNVKTEEPLKVADKISGLHGNKHIIAAIIPDDKMPYVKDTGERIELTMSPIGVSNRINTSQLLENAAGKIAQKTGKPYVITNFKDVDNTEQMLNDLKAAELSDKDVLVDPETGKTLKNPVANGISHILKLEHKVDHKLSARYRDGYDSNEQAASGGHTGGKNLGRMEMAALLARGADENLKEMFQIKGQRNDEYWKAMETGQSLPIPKKAFVWDKMLAAMAGAGINVEQKGKVFTMGPMTDAAILEMSKGELKNPSQTYRKKDMAPIREGLFDPVKAGGMQGEYYTHFKLPEKVLNPVTANAAANLMGIPQVELERVMTGKKFVDRKTGEIVDPGTPGALSGGPAVETLLKQIDVERDLKAAEERIKTLTNPTEINKYNKKIKTLRSLKENGLKPTDYMIENVLVTPSKFRPMFSMGTEGTVVLSDINDLYQQTAKTAETFQEYKNELSKVVKDQDVINVQLAESRKALYEDVKAVTGLGDPTSYLLRQKNKKGFVTQIDGGKDRQTKQGLFQSRVMQRRQDLVGRSTIILNPHLGGDELGIPKEMATQIFQPFIMQKLVSWGYRPLDAQKQVADDTEIFQRARQVVADERLVIANRAPTLHRWNMTAFKPKLTDGKSIEVPGIVVGRNFSGDFDGDTFQIHVPVGPKAMKEAALMKPSAGMLKAGYDSVLNMPGQDMVVGNYLVSKGIGGEVRKDSYADIDEARAVFKSGKLSYADTVTIDGIKAPFGMHEINDVVPEDVRDYKSVLNDKTIEEWIKKVTLKYNGKMGMELANKMKDVGNDYTTEYGFTMGVSDTSAAKDIRKSVVDAAIKKTDWKNPVSIIENFQEATRQGVKQLKDRYGDSTMLGIGMESGGSKGIGNTSAITLMPGILSDSNDKPMPIPITKSYSEGLNTAAYWAAAHGARGGNIKKSVSSFMPGWLTKDLINSVYEVRIAEEDPVDTDGVEYSIDNKKAVANRYLARDVKDSGGKILAKRNDPVDENVINKLTKAKVKTVFVQSPLTDPTPGDGFSSWSYGSDFEGNRKKFGDHIGIQASHTITEPSLNLAMKSFHTGGSTLGKSSGSVFDVLDRTLRFTKKIPDKATVANMDGVITKITKSSIGGNDITISNGDYEEVRYVDTNRSVTANVGDRVKQGDVLSDGTVSPHDVLKYKGMKEAQLHLVNEIDKIMPKLNTRDIETVVRGITNTTRILDPGSSTWVKGDVAPMTTVENYNRNNMTQEDVESTVGDHFSESVDKFAKNHKITEEDSAYLYKKGVRRIPVFKDRIKHEPFLTPNGIGEKAAVSDDWIARLAHSRLRKVFEEGTTQAWKSDVGKDLAHPVSSLVTIGYT